MEKFIKVTKALSLKDKCIGLIGKEKYSPILIKTRFGIHTFAMKHPIDVVILDKQGYIVKIKINLKPWRIFFWNPKYDTVIELPQNTINQEKLKIGDKLNIK